jgi:hypothetical protein
LDLSLKHWSTAETGHCTCRVDHPSDLISVTSPDDPLLEGTGWAPPDAAVLKPSGIGGKDQLLPTGTVLACKQSGNALYLCKRYVDALHIYRQGLGALQAAGDQAGDDSRQLRVDLLNNCAACCLSLGTPEAAATGVGYARAAQQAAGPGGNAKAQLREAKLLMGACR